VPAVRQDLRIPEDAFVVSFIGALDEAHYFKRLDLLLRAINRTNSPNVWILIVGGGELVPSFQALSVQLGISERTRFAGAVPHSKLAPYLSAGDILVLPSTEVESFGMVLIEAMACNRPVVATSLPGISEVVSDGEDGYLVPPGNIDALAQAILRLEHSTVSRRAEMGALGRQKVERQFDWERIGDRLESIYRDVRAETAGKS
jgi:glycosyltransferase involved in cell wall biosynthesis